MEFLHTEFRIKEDNGHPEICSPFLTKNDEYKPTLKQLFWPGRVGKIRRVNGGEFFMITSWEQLDFLGKSRESLMSVWGVSMKEEFSV
ncbi:hypothetical protein X798_02402 [Onchocerca flexuosa]|uniref:DUF1738 domain-containing protein n=2 Tax=Onchocerca flexuosa TaxID=387005 RepID=A0A183I0B8_9BILA|nr:hypothetical protein X798_02402 [Onchocerca flexuosa]VDP13103.1 unnamed protein product [Onchocerca flexuosa]